MNPLYATSGTVPRLNTLDCIRGVALLGILIMNIQTYALFALLNPSQVYALNLDHIETYPYLQFFIRLFIRGQFYTIYSFLFGISFYLIMEKCQRIGLDGYRIFKRRLWSLLFIGLIHGLIFWFGDVLHKYAVLGFSLLYFNRKSIKTIFHWIVGLTVAVIISQVIIVMIFTPESTRDSASMQKAVMMGVKIWQHGSVPQVVMMQSLGVINLWILAFTEGFRGLVHYEIMFLLGLVAGKVRFFYHVSDWKTYLHHRIMMLVPSALALKALSCVDYFGIEIIPGRYGQLLHALFEFVGTPLLTVVYLWLLVLLFEGRRSYLFTWFSNAGKLGLTNYLMQTLICIVLFYGYSLGLSGTVTLGQTLLIALAIYTFQLWYSSLWVPAFGTGPIERIWQRLTYGKRAVQKTL